MSNFDSQSDRKPAVLSSKLKFGVDRLLSPDPVKPTATSPRVPPVPCSDCVTSLLRCCRLGPSHQDAVQGYGLSTQGTYGGVGIYTLHTPTPVRPVATRPGKTLL